MAAILSKGRWVNAANQRTIFLECWMLDLEDVDDFYPICQKNADILAAKKKKNSAW